MNSSFFMRILGFISICCISLRDFLSWKWFSNVVFYKHLRNFGLVIQGFRLTKRETRYTYHNTFCVKQGCVLTNRKHGLDERATRLLKRISRLPKRTSRLLKRVSRLVNRTPRLVNRVFRLINQPSRLSNPILHLYSYKQMQNSFFHHIFNLNILIYEKR